MTTNTETRERPIPFTGPEVRAILEGRKTQTRRVVKPQPYRSNENPPRFGDTKVGDIFDCPDLLPTSSVRGRVFAECEAPGVYHCMGQRAFVEKHCPYGAPGDTLWVRETWQPFFKDGAIYLADAGTPALNATSVEDAKSKWPGWRPSIHMPRWASRLTLRVTSVSVERLQEITAEDALAEGIQVRVREVSPGKVVPMINISADPEPDGVSSKPWREWTEDDIRVHEFAIAWDSIHGKRAPWSSNPWVFVISFERVESPCGGPQSDRTRTEVGT